MSLILLSPKLSAPTPPPPPPPPPAQFCSYTPTIVVIVTPYVPVTPSCP